MDKKVVLSVICTVLISTLCDGIGIEDSIDTKNNLPSNYVEILSKCRPTMKLPINPGIYRKQQEVQEMREKLSEYNVLLKEHRAVLAMIYKKISFYCGLPAGVLCGICGSISFRSFGFMSSNNLSSILTYIIVFGLSFCIPYYVITNICYVLKAGMIFDEWNYKKQLEEKLTEYSAAITNLGTSLSKNEIVALEKEFTENKEIRQLLIGILLTK